MEYRKEVFELPCGYLDEETHLLYTHAEVREMTGREEDMLTDRKKLRSGASIDNLLANCTEFILQPDENRKNEMRVRLSAEQVLKLTQGDRLFLLIKIRQVSHGADYKFELECPHCQKKNIANILLSDIQSKKMPTPKERHYDVQLGDDLVTFKISTGEEEVKMRKMVEQNPDKLATANLAARLVTVNGETTRPIQYLQQLPARLRDAFRARAIEVEGGVDTLIKGLECVGCNGSIDIDLPLQESFFLPQSAK